VSAISSSLSLFSVVCVWCGALPFPFSAAVLGCRAVLLVGCGRFCCVSPTARRVGSSSRQREEQRREDTQAERNTHGGRRVTGSYREVVCGTLLCSCLSGKAAGLWLAGTGCSAQGVEHGATDMSASARSAMELMSPAAIRCCLHSLCAVRHGLSVRSTSASASGSGPAAASPHCRRCCFRRQRGALREPNSVRRAVLYVNRLVLLQMA